MDWMVKHMSMEPCNPSYDTELILEDRLEIPRRYRVLLHNDDYTTMDFVVAILIDIFRKTPQAATAIMLAIHEQGTGECGVYTHELAETKVALVHTRAKQEGFPLRCTMEEV